MGPIRSGNQGDMERQARLVAPEVAGVDQEWPKVVRVHTIDTSVRLVAQDEVQAEERFEALRHWLQELSFRRHSGMRFLFWLGATARAAQHITQEHSARDAEGEPVSTWLVSTAFEFVGDSEALARERFDGFRVWLRRLKDRGHSGLRFVQDGTFGEPDAVRFSHETEITHEEVISYRAMARAWFDPNDRGQVKPGDVEAVFRWDASEELSLRTDERVEVVESLRMVAELLPTVEADRYRWKWVVIALHNALQASMVAALTDTSFQRVVKRPRLSRQEQRKRRLRWLRPRVVDVQRRSKQGRIGRREPRVSYQLDDFLELYDKIKKPAWMNRYGEDNTFRPCGTQGASVKRLNTLRNEFIHFVPALTRRGIVDLPQLVSDCATVVAWLATESNAIDWWLDQPNPRAEVEVLLERIANDAVRLAEVYAMKLAEITSN